MERRVITVFGGSGFVGRHLVRRLAADGWIVRVAVRDPLAAAFLKPMGEAGQIVLLKADVADRDAVAPALAGAQAAVNLCGILYERGRQTFQRIHVDGATAVAAAAAAAGCARLVQMSAIGAHPDSDSVYARTKAAGERAAAEGFPGASVVRPSVVFGPEDGFFNRFAELARFAPALPVFETAFQPVYVGDVADAIRRILEDPATRGKTYELGGPRVITFREMLEIVFKETGRKRLLFPMPLGLAAVQAFFTELLPTPPLTRDQVKLLARKNVVAPGALTLADLGITPTAVEAIVPGYLSRYRSGRRRLSGA